MARRVSATARGFSTPSLLGEVYFPLMVVIRKPKIKLPKSWKKIAERSLS